MIERTKFRSRTENQLRVHPACGLLGPRQCGKTTMADAMATAYNGEAAFLALFLQIVIMIVICGAIPIYKHS